MPATGSSLPRGSGVHPPADVTEAVPSGLTPSAVSTPGLAGRTPVRVRRVSSGPRAGETGQARVARAAKVTPHAG